MQSEKKELVIFKLIGSGLFLITDNDQFFFLFFTTILFSLFFAIKKDIEEIYNADVMTPDTQSQSNERFQQEEEINEYQIAQNLQFHIQ